MLMFQTVMDASAFCYDGIGRAPTGGTVRGLWQGGI